jgi:hypothetical protein
MKDSVNSAAGDHAENPVYRDFLLGYYEATNGVNEYFHVSWSDLTPSELIAGLNGGKLWWDSYGDDLYSDVGMIARARTTCCGDGLDVLIEEKAFFLPSSEPNTVTEFYLQEMFSLWSGPDDKWLEFLKTKGVVKNRDLSEATAQNFIANLGRTRSFANMAVDAAIPDDVPSGRKNSFDEL